jgi:hypothetical protein
MPRSNLVMASRDLKFVTNDQFDGNYGAQSTSVLRNKNRFLIFIHLRLLNTPFLRLHKHFSPATHTGAHVPASPLLYLNIKIGPFDEPNNCILTRSNFENSDDD